MPKQHFSKILWLTGVVILCGVVIFWFTTAQRVSLPINLMVITPLPSSTNTLSPTSSPLSLIPLFTSTSTPSPDLGNYDQQVVFAQSPITNETFTNPYGNGGWAGRRYATSGWLGKTRIYRVSLKESPQYVLEIPFPRTIRPHGMILSPNGETLGIWMLDHDYPKESDLYQLSLRTGELLRVPLTAERGTLYFWDGIDWSPDSSRFAFSLLGNSGLPGSVEMGFRESTKRSKVANTIPSEGIRTEASLPAVWSPDSSQFATTNLSTTKNIWFINREGTQVAPLFSQDLEISIEAPYVWSPDSKYLAFSRPREQPYQDIYLIDVSKKQVTQVTDFAKSFPQNTSAIAKSLVWLPDSQTILFALALDRKPYRVMSLNVTTRQITILSDFPPAGSVSSDPKNSVFYADDFVLSPNGKFLLVATNDSKSEHNLPLDPIVQLYVGIDTQTGKVVWRFPDNKYVRNPRWSPDNYFIAAESGPNIYAWNIVTGKEIKLTDSKSDSVNYLLGWIPKVALLPSASFPPKTP